MAKKNNGYLLVFSAGTLWGTIGLFVKQMESGGSSPTETAFLRVFFAFLIMLVICICRGGWRSLRTDCRTLVICALLGIVCHGIYNIFYSFAVTTAGVSISAVLLNIAPIFTLLCSSVLFQERFTSRKIIAIGINIIGCILTVTNGHLDISVLPLAGIICGIGAGFCYAMTAIIGRFGTAHTDPYVLSMYSYLAASVPLFLWMKPWENSHAFSMDICLWGFLFALIPTAFAYILYYQGLQQIEEPGKVPVIASIETVAATLIGIFGYHERLGIVSLLGILLVLISIFIMNHEKKTVGSVRIRNFLCYDINLRVSEKKAARHLAQCS